MLLMMLLVLLDFDPSTLNAQLGCLVLIMLCFVLCAFVFWAWPSRNREEIFVDDEDEE